MSCETALRSALLCVAVAAVAVLVCSVERAHCSIALEVFGYLDQSIEFRCVSNETSKFTRIRHTLTNGSVETLLSNEYLNTNYRRSEVHVEKYGHTYIIRIDPIKLHSAGMYTCEDDISQHDKLTHNTNITLHVISIN